MFLNRGIEEFESVVNSQIYVDKTGMIDFFNNIIDTEQRYVCVSRPRRFGKSIAANMIAAYYERGSDSRSLFEGRKLSKYDNWDRNMNKYDVIRIDMVELCAEMNSPEHAMDYMEKNIIRELKEAYLQVDIDIETDTNGGGLATAFALINEAVGAKFIII